MKILVIQTAFIGDVILATSVLEKLHHSYPAAKLDFLVRKGNEPLFQNHPYLHELLVWDKSRNKIGNLFRLIGKIRSADYEYVVDLHRHLSSGLLTACSRSRNKFGFDKNPLSAFFTKKFPHDLRSGKHETERNQQLIVEISDTHPAKPRLYPAPADFAAAETCKKGTVPSSTGAYITVSPASVWFTKQFPAEKWIEWINERHPKAVPVFLLGASGDAALCEHIRNACSTVTITVLAGKLSLLESAALMKGAAMNYTNDSAPMHLASAVNAPVTAIFTSTVPLFGFGPLSDQHKVVETTVKLDCRPCGLHGFKACPQKHFKCALTIRKEDIPVVQ